MEKAYPGIPNIGPRKRYLIVGTASSWVYHKMAAGATMDGAAPTTATLTADKVDPTVSAGLATFDDLTHGGLFTLVANYRMPIVIEAIDNPGSATLVTVTRAGAAMRTLDPAKLPIKLSPGEVIKVTGGGAAGKVGFLLRYDADRVL